MKRLFAVLIILLCTSIANAQFTGQTTGYYGSDLNWFAGVSWDELNDTYLRTDYLYGYPNGSSPGNAAMPIHAGMKRAILNDAGVVQYYLCATNSTLRENCITAADLTGVTGQVMVEIPAFYYLYSYAGTTHTWKISQYPRVGYVIHPAFTKDGVNVAYRYIGAYEGVLWDTSIASYTDGNVVGQVKDFTATTGDKLSSVSGKYAVVNGTRANFRTIAANRGTGWRQLDYDLHSAIQLLYLVEYASFYTQSVIGAGITNVTDWSAYNTIYPLARSGNSNGIGNATDNTAGSTSALTESTKYMSYRGIEQWYGHLWKYVDGININAGRPYATNVRANFADDTTINYTDLGATMGTVSGYQNTLIQIGRGFLPASVGGTSSTKITDYYNYAVGWRVLVVGGSSSDGVQAGSFYVDADFASTALHSYIGGRVTY